MAICNVPGSQATRISDGVIYTHAGPRDRRRIDQGLHHPAGGPLPAWRSTYARSGAGEIDRELVATLAHLPQAVDEIIQQEAEIEELGRRFHRAEDFLYLGRGINYPIALEGALKLKEISYIHAEGYTAGEMKHGPIALIDEDLPVVAVATGEKVYDKVRSNLQEVKARDGVVIAITDRDPEDLEGVADEVIEVPRVSDLLQPVVNVIPLQLLAYFIGVRRGADVDQPRNLAKSVTVE